MPLNPKQVVEPLTARTLKRINAETVLETDTPRTSELKTLRIKRLAYFVPEKEHCQRSCISASLPPRLQIGSNPGIPDNRVGDPLKDKLAKYEKEGLSVQEILNSNESVEQIVVGDTEKSHSTSSEPSSATAKSHLRNACFPEPDYNLLEDPMVSENQKLTHILNWAQNILRKSDECRDEAKSSKMSQRACRSQSNEEVPALRRECCDGEQSRASLYRSWDIDGRTTADLFSSRVDASHYSADISSLSNNYCSSEISRSSHTFLQTDCLTAGSIDEVEQHALTHSGGLNRRQWFSGAGETEKLERTIPKQDNIYGGSIPNKDCKTEGTAEIHVHATLSEYPADDDCHSVTGGAGTENNNEYFWVPLEDNSDEEDTKGGMERKQMIVQPFVNSNQLCNENYEESVLSTGPAKPRKSSVKYCYTSSDLSASPLQLNNVAQHSTSAVDETRVLNSKGTEKTLSSENDPLQKEVNHNIDKNEVQQSLIEHKVHNRPLNVLTSTFPSCLSPSSNSSYSKDPSLPFQKEKFINREEQPNADCSSFVGSDLVKFCPECLSGNDPNINWCMECGCVLIGILTRQCPVSTNVAEISSLITRQSPEKEKLDVLVKGSLRPCSEFVRPDNIYDLKCSKTFTCTSSGERELRVYENYLLYSQPLKKFSNQHQAQKEQQPIDQHLVNEQGSRTDALNGNSKRHKAKENYATSSSETSTLSSDLIDLRSEDKLGRGAAPLTGNTDECCVVQSFSVLENHPQGKDYFEKPIYKETSKDPTHKAFLKQAFGTLKDETVTCTGHEKKKGNLKDTDVTPVRRKSIQASLKRHKRYWEKSSIAWSSYTHGEVKPRSKNIYSTQSTGNGRMSSKKSLQCEDPPAGVCVVPVPNSRRIKGQLANRPLSAGTLESERVAQETLISKVLPNFQNASLRRVNAWTTSDHLCSDVFQPCDKLTDMNPGGGDDRSLWLYLPDELWISVLTLLSHRDLCQLSQVSHRFHRLANDETLWKLINIDNSNCLNDDCIVNIGRHQPQSLRLYRCNDGAKPITETGLRELFRQCKDSLKELNVTSCSGLNLRGDQVLLQASAVCCWLVSVDVSWSGATDSGIVALVEACSRLQRLCVNGCHLTDEAINVLSKKHGKSLRDLEVFGCHTLSAHCLSYMAQRCRDLQILNIGRLPKITAICLVQIVTCLTSLMTLNLSGLNAVRDHVVHHVVRQCPKMERLTLSSCLQVTDVSLVEISTYLPTIRHLDVSGCKKITDTGVQAIAMGCQQLQYLDLSSTAASKRGICLLSTYCNRHLTCVKLSFCKYLTEDVIKKLCKNCKHLTMLHLYGCRSIHNLKAIQDVNKLVKLFHDLSVSTLKTQGC
ncbi:uncharacterized protein LOC103187373 [Callorhinchus milii]|uniref:uncharacterized protein LOC103187373 n=1 Tax=Callorhinchus milii TaxID=7868 RepID=UPI001C3FCFD3|nr:uncharacterized protein LOC103187373 [Callorhinchus milii]